jgi:bHLH factor
MAAVLPNKRKRDNEDLGAQRPAPVMSDNAFDPHVVHYDLPTDHNMDFVAQHNAGFGAAPDPQQDSEHKFVQLDSTNNAGQSASDTAAAAMAQYHTMTVPQSTEQAFMSHPGDGTDRPGSSSLDQGNPGEQQRTSFSDFDISTLKGDAPETAEGDGSPSMGAAGIGGQKPQVGSDEWHKVRRDNHKEGTPTLPPSFCWTLTNLYRSGTASP